MGLLDKIMFWKKEEEPLPEFPAPAEMTPAEPSAPMGMEHFGMPRPMPGVTEPPVEAPAFAPPQSFQQQQQFAPSTEQQLQLISSKLDTIKAQLETVLQRLDRLERKDELSPYQQRWRST